MLCVALFVVAYLAAKVVSDDAVRREQEHRFMLDAMELVKAQSVAEVAEVEIARASARISFDERESVDSTWAADLKVQGDNGWYGAVAEGRAAMVAAGKDPDDPDAVVEWNERLGEMHA